MALSVFLCCAGSDGWRGAPHPADAGQCWRIDRWQTTRAARLAGVAPPAAAGARLVAAAPAGPGARVAAPVVPGVVPVPIGPWADRARASREVAVSRPVARRAV